MIRQLMSYLEKLVRSKIVYYSVYIADQKNKELKEAVNRVISISGKHKVSSC
ncbi:hypothetical protein WH47_10001 [Habropoda laboriosa]|uniref:Uncharacterized protein n=1 Tax=Habropoda laboriosa TaxID=597456 RepID=A0A0L7R3G6_9HYME|nr:hypothetical protein WH47_10001 [Habropoda laboriosa]